jgi:uncharacterized membrane protein
MRYQWSNIQHYPSKSSMKALGCTLLKPYNMYFLCTICIFLCTICTFMYFYAKIHIQTIKFLLHGRIELSKNCKVWERVSYKERKQRVRICIFSSYWTYYSMWYWWLKNKHHTHLRGHIHPLEAEKNCIVFK